MKEKIKDKITGFFDDVVKEMKKVTWPTKAELIESTQIVLFVCLVLAAFTWVVDLFVSYLFKQLF